MILISIIEFYFIQNVNLAVWVHNIYLENHNQNWPKIETK
jgi:hypothetical protein